jgi:hypothetical protein
MVRRSLIVAVLMAASSPLAAQDEWVWTGDRPDADAPLGVIGARTLDMGVMEVGYRFSQTNSRGVWFANDSLPLATTLQLYPVVPLTLSQQTHSAIFSWGLLDNLTLIGTAEFTIFERDQLTDTGILYITRIEALGDVTGSAVYEVYRSGPYRGNLSMGVVIPVGKARTWADTPFGIGQALPYDQRPGAGSFALTPGATFQVQNENGSLGMQFRSRIYLDVHAPGVIDWTPGDRYHADGWAAYKINDAFSISAGVRWAMWGRIEGADTFLDPSMDPGSDPVTGQAGGQRADLPVGITLKMPGGPLEGHRIQLESIYTLHHDYEGARLGQDWAIQLGWTAGLDLF